MHVLQCSANSLEVYFIFQNFKNNASGHYIKLHKRYIISFRIFRLSFEIFGWLYYFLTRKKLVSEYIKLRILSFRETENFRDLKIIQLVIT